MDWTAVTWENLRIPLISGIAARIFFEIQERLGEPIPGIGDVQGQGEYWKGTGFNDNEVDTAEFFVLSVTLLELEGTKLTDYIIIITVLYIISCVARVYFFTEACTG